MYNGILVLGLISVLVCGGGSLALCADGAFAPQPGLEPDALERFLAGVRPRLKRIRQWPSRLVQHHGVKVYHAFLRWQGYKPLVLSKRTVWVPTHTILTPYETF